MPSTTHTCRAYKEADNYNDNDDRHLELDEMLSQKDLSDTYYDPNRRPISLLKMRWGCSDDIRQAE